MAKRAPYLHEEQIERDAAALLAEYDGRQAKTAQAFLFAAE